MLPNYCRSNDSNLSLLSQERSLVWLTKLEQAQGGALFHVIPFHEPWLHASTSPLPRIPKPSPGETHKQSIGHNISCYRLLIDCIGKWQIKWLPCLPTLWMNCFSGSTEMCDWLSNLYHATGWPRSIQEKLLITAHCFVVVFTRVSRHLSRGVRRILLGQTTCVSRL